MIKNNPEDIKKHTGLHNGFYRAVVKDIDDPLLSGRVRVRIWGLHSQSTTKTSIDGIPDNELPWAEPMLPVAEGGLTKYGLFSVPLVDSHVMVVFENGNPLRPIYIGSLPGGNGDWDTRGGTYPQNTVLSVHGGHYIELDSTSGNTRVKINHKSGTNIEMKENGDITITGTNDVTVNAAGKCDITATGECNVTAATVDIDGGGGTLKGTVNGDSICPLTGSPHFHISSDVKNSIGA